MRKRPAIDLPSLRQYHLAKGQYLGARRTETRAHRRLLGEIADWYLGRLAGGARNLAVNVPPRFGKTAVACDMIEYTLGVWPDAEFIYTAYSADLAVEQVRKIKETLDSDWYRAIFPWMRVTEGQQKYFRTAQGGSVYGAGMAGSITGFGAGKKNREGFGGAIVIDDPMKADQARSETTRKHLRDWYTGTLLSRRNARATPILLIAQRLHPQDLAGYIETKFAKRWRFVKMPLIEPGSTETIWPEVYDYDEALELKEVDPFAFHAQYQQEPTYPGGALLKTAWWRHWRDRDDVERRCDCKIITADTAYGAGEANDYSVFQCWGFEGARRMYLLDQIRGRWGYEELLPAAIAFWDKHQGDDADGAALPATRLYIENKASGQSLVQQHDLFRERGVNAFPWNARDFGPTDKVGRVKETVPLVFSGDVVLPEPAAEPWVEDFIAECGAFAEDMSHGHDDQVDALTMAALFLRAMRKGGLAS